LKGKHTKKNSHVCASEGRAARDLKSKPYCIDIMNSSMASGAQFRQQQQQRTKREAIYCHFGRHQHKIKLFYFTVYNHSEHRYAKYSCQFHTTPLRFRDVLCLFCLWRARFVLRCACGMRWGGGRDWV
jgi:hypothetical protein